MERKLPPFSRPLFDLIKNNSYPANLVWLYIGNYAWKQAKESSLLAPNRTMALPPWECPNRYFWPVKKCKVLIVDTGYAEDTYTKDLVIKLLESHAQIVFFSTPVNGLSIYRRENL